jgi:hypothetical protein
VLKLVGALSSRLFRICTEGVFFLLFYILPLELTSLCSLCYHFLIYSPSGKVRASGDSACAAPADCSGDSDCTHGSCTDSKCVCSSGWAGPACDETALFTLAVVTTLGGYSKDTFDILKNRVAFKTGVAANFASSSVAASQMYVTAVADVTGLLASSVKVSFSIMNVAAAAKSTITAALAAADQSTLVTKLKTAGLSETTSASSTSSASEESAGSAGTPVPIESTPAGTGGTAAVDTAAFTTVALNTDLTLKYRTDANSVSVQLTLAKGSGWLAVGTHATSPDTMIGSRVVMGLPGATTPTSVYDLEGKSASMVKVATKQSITAASLTQTSTSTVLSFKCVLGLKAADGDLQLEAATNNLVWAYGSSNSKSAHIARGSQGIDFSGASNTTNSTSPSGLYKSKAIIWLAHGVCMALAWGVMVPTGIVTARHFKGLPGDATWFKRHRAIQMCAVVIAVAGLIFAVVGHGDGIHFTTPHSWVGLFAMLIAFIQPLAICFRGHKPEEGEPKTTYRLAWEITHKWGGRLGAIAAIVNVSLGTFINSSIYIESGAGPNIIILCLFVCMVVVYLYGIYCEMRKQAEARYKVSV